MGASGTTVSAGFRELLSRVELNPSRVSIASQRYHAVSDRIRTVRPNYEVRQIGSFQRKTKIRPRTDSDPLDIDAAVCFGDAFSYASDGSGITPSDALAIVRKALESDKTYKLMDPAIDSPTVVLEYADGFKIELVPCYRERTGKFSREAGPDCYIVGSPDGQWLAADYDYDAAFIGGLNQIDMVQRALVPSIKMIKAFLRNREIRLKSFHVEVLCARLIPAALIDWQSQNLRWDYHHILSYFLSNAYSLLNGPVGIPNSYSRPVDSNLSAFDLQQIGGVLNQWGNAAWGICKMENEAAALKVWRQFFGEPFPA
jgi:hypothetical protein